MSTPTDPEVLVDATGTRDQIKMIRTGLGLIGTITAEGKARQVRDQTGRVRVRYAVRVTP